MKFFKNPVVAVLLTVLLVVDVSASGDYGSGSRSRRTAAAELAALLAFAAGRNGDKAGLLMYSDRCELYVPPRSGRRHALRIVREVLAHRPRSRGTDLAGALREAAQLREVTLQNVNAVKRTRVNNDLFLLEVDLRAVGTISSFTAFWGDLAALKPAMAWRRLEIRSMMSTTFKPSNTLVVMELSFCKVSITFLMTR